MCGSLYDGWPISPFFEVDWGTGKGHKCVIDNLKNIVTSKKVGTVGAVEINEINDPSSSKQIYKRDAIIV